jgi:hypothetical protein
VRAGLPKLRWHDLRHTWATWHAQAGTPAIVLQVLGGWKDARMVRTYTHLAALDLLDHANAIRLPAIPLPAGTNSSTVASGDDEEQEQVLDEIGVDDGIRTHNNRNHKGRVTRLRPQDSSTCDSPGRPKTRKRRA